MSVRTARFGSLLGVTAGLLLAGAGVASAHVTVAAPGVYEGQSDASINFRVPDESATASTIGLKLQLPTDHPIAGVLIAPVAGWAAKITNTKLATPITTDDGTITEVVSEIDWTASPDAGIKPGYFGQFTIIAGQLPDGVGSLTFKAIQTYSDHSVVSWIEEAAPGSTTEPDHPAPKLTLLPTPAQEPVSSSAGATSPAAVPSSNASLSVTGAGVSQADADPPTKGSVTTALIVGIVGIVVGAIGIGLAVASRRRPV